jgi:hypothetical protein
MCVRSDPHADNYIVIFCLEVLLRTTPKSNIVNVHSIWNRRFSPCALHSTRCMRRMEPGSLPCALTSVLTQGWKKAKHLFQNAITSEWCIHFYFHLYRCVLRDETNKLDHTCICFEEFYFSNNLCALSYII